MSLRLISFSMWVPFLAIILRLASAPTANISFFVLAGYALMGRVQAIQALALSWVFSMLSEGVAPEASAASIGRYAVVICAAISVFLRVRQTKIDKSDIQLVLVTFVFGILIVIHSFLFSPIPDVSILKAVLWTIVMTALLLAWVGMNYKYRAQLELQLLYGMALLALISFPLIFSGLGYLVNGTGFQGVFSQPQAFGPAMALLGAWLTSNLLSEKRPQWGFIALAGLCFVMVILSKARTAGLAFILGVSMSVIVSLLVSGISVKKSMPGLLSGKLRILGVVAVVVMVLNASMFTNVVKDFMTKGEGATSFSDAYETSRGELIYMMVGNIKSDPWRGIGFGIASWREKMIVVRDSVLGLPISATIEKGVLPLAVLEELGVVGFFLFLLLIMMYLKRAVSGGVAPLAVFITVILFNMGESTFFSTSGFGLFPMILLAWAVTSRPRLLKVVKRV